MTDLTSRGLVETRPGAGTFVTSRKAPTSIDAGWQTSSLGLVTETTLPFHSPMDLDTSNVIPLHAGYPEPALQPIPLVRTSIRSSLSNPTSFQAPNTRGIPELRDWFANDSLSSYRENCYPVSRDNVIILPGSQQGLVALFRSIVGTGNSLIMESPTYWGAIMAARRANVRTVPLTRSASGPDPDELDQLLTRSGAKVFYAQPSYANPSGNSWSRSNAEKIRQILYKHQAFMIEDDWAHDFGIDNSECPMHTIDNRGAVIYIRSLSKSLSPAIRVAGIIAHGPVYERIQTEVRDQNLFVSPLLQNATLHAVTSPQWKTHLRKLNRDLRQRRDALISAINSYSQNLILETVPSGGLNLWVQIPDHIEPSLLIQSCMTKGVGLADGRAWFPAEPLRNYARMNFASCKPELFNKAVMLVQQSIDDLSKKG